MSQLWGEGGHSPRAQRLLAEEGSCPQSHGGARAWALPRVSPAPSLQGAARGPRQPPRSLRWCSSFPAPLWGENSDSENLNPTKSGAKSFCSSSPMKSGDSYFRRVWSWGVRVPQCSQRPDWESNGPKPGLCGKLVPVSPGALTLRSVPPLGFGGGKYVSFEDRHWHHNCFNCARCNTSLVGKGFIPDNDEILCRDCSSDL